MATHVDREARPDHEVRRRRSDLLIAPRAPVRLRRRNSGQAAHDPLLASRIDLGEFKPTREADVALFIGRNAGRRSAGRSGSARAHTRQGIGVRLSSVRGEAAHRLA